ncbi:MAG: class II aldolase/adducin family protein [Betaproteobacteria bacterium]|nr:MAG: class II aldolase/adducin family protein [Betaproteobacteria bacterium]
MSALLGATLPAEAQSNPASAGPADPKLIEDLVAANRILAKEGVLDGYGHVSVRHNRNPNRYLMSRYVPPALVVVEDIAEYDLDSNPVNPKTASYSERFIHGEIYKTRPDVKAVVHNHSPSLIPFGITGTPLKPTYHMSAFVGQGVPVFEIRSAAGMTDMLVRNPALGQALASALGDHPAVLMRGHGAVVVGPTLPLVVGRSVYLEINARVQMQATALGGNPTFLDPEEVHKVEERQDYKRAWELWKRSAMAK